MTSVRLSLGAVVALAVNTACSTSVNKHDGMFGSATAKSADANQDAVGSGTSSTSPPAPAPHSSSGTAVAPKANPVAPPSPDPSGGNGTPTPPVPLSPNPPPTVIAPPSCQGAGTTAEAKADSGLKSILYPVDRSIIQRGSDNNGQIPVAAWVDSQITCLEVSVIATANYQTPGLTLTWRKLDNLALVNNNNGTSTLTGTFPQAAGGWFYLNFRAWSGPSTYTTVDPSIFVGHVGVGEVFVVAGQSNSSNCGSATMNSFVPNDLVSTAALAPVTATSNSTSSSSSNPNGTWAILPAAWTNAVTPIAGPGDGCTGGGPWGWAGSLLATTLNVPVGFALTGFAGTQSARWLPTDNSPPNCVSVPGDVCLATASSAGGGTGYLINRLIATAQNLTKFSGGFRAVLWHQGEGDAQNSVAGTTYEQNIRTMIATFRQATSGNAPWLISEASWLPLDSSGETAVQQMVSVPDIEAAQRRMRSDPTNALYPGVITDDLQSCDYRDCPGNNNHFSYLGLTIHGQRWHDAILSYLTSYGGVTAN